MIDVKFPAVKEELAYVYTSKNNGTDIKLLLFRLSWIHL